MKLQPKAVFIDLDGTLLDRGFWHYARISNKNIEAIHRIKEKFPVVISTGRSLNDQTKKIIQLLGINYAVCQNGSVIIDKDFNYLRNIVLDNDLVKAIAQKVEEWKLTFSINSTNEIYGNKTKTYLISKFSHLIPEKFANAKIPLNGVNKLLIIGFSKIKIKKFAKYLENNFNGITVKIVGRNWAIEVTDKNATKGLANAFVAKKYLKIDPKETIHIGDSMNDSTVIGHMGKLISMKNSIKKFKKIAHEVGPNRKNGGVAKILSKEFPQNIS
ncbi:HAD family hydrolase [Mycoplasma iguanae]|uniref:HAD family hydrolase n=1 Tax=Mycoplasma iguanae TaxID=292461 RepID=A0ABY5RBH6_9MOLU|nr:HAD family hydrolase [Mycoplasma iguanae]UVD81565.1 HAD family hydrolase [Mycoplasma iguanae]